MAKVGKQKYQWYDATYMIFYYKQYIPEIMNMVCALLIFVMVGYQWILPISLRVTSLALGKSNDCPSASETTLKKKGKFVAQINMEW